MAGGFGLGYFRRTLKFLHPQRRRILIAVLCSVGLALSLAGSLSAVQPILRIFVTELHGPRAAVFQMAAERAFAVSLQPYQPSRHGDFAVEVPSGALIVKSLRDGSPLIEAAVREGDVLLPDDTSSSSLVERLGTSDRPLSLRIAGPQSEVVRTIALAGRDLGIGERLLVDALRFAGDLLPTDTSPRATRNALIMVLSGVFVLVLFSNACRFTAEYMVLIASNRAVMDIRREMYRTIMHLPLTWFSRHLSETMSRIVTDCKDVERGYRALFGKLITEPIKIVVLLIAAILTDWRITLFVVIAGPLGIFIVSRMGKKIRKANRKLLAGYAQMMGVINAALAGIRVVRASNNQTLERRRMWQAERRLLKQLVKIGRFEAMVGPMLEVSGVALALAGVVVMAEYALGGRLPAERFIGLVLFIVFTFDSIRKISEVYPRLARADGAAQRAFEMIDQPVEQRHEHGRQVLAAPRESIEFRDVTFTYPESQHPALIGVNLTIPVGQRVALVGPNGSGKTTCISLLERFLECSSGQILFDGQDIRRFGIASLRDQISLITQDAVVFALSVHENITYGRQSATVQEVISAAQKAHAHEFIERLPQGYGTVLGEFGATLSGGERQRLALARAILRNAPIFIFDEATSQIDLDSEKKIQEATTSFMRGRTSIVVAHRINTITDADQIAVFDQGRLLDTGTHAALLQRCEMYRILYHAHTAAP